jgi:hypothetical protein
MRESEFWEGTGIILVVMQRVHQDDLSGYLLRDSEEVYEHLELSAIAQIPKRIPLGRGRFSDWPVGEALHPAFESLETLQMMRREMGSQVFSAHYLQRPIPQGGAMLQSEWFQRSRPFRISLAPSDAVASQIRSDLARGIFRGAPYLRRRDSPCRCRGLWPSAGVVAAANCPPTIKRYPFPPHPMHSMPACKPVPRHCSHGTGVFSLFRGFADMGFIGSLAAPAVPRHRLVSRHGRSENGRTRNRVP